MPVSGPYRSRLLNVLNRQTRQWVDQSTQVWRQLKVATLWGVQLLLYPIYWMFQTGRIVGKQLQQAERQVAHFRLQLEARRQPHPPLTADTAIHTVLQAIEAMVPPLALPTAEPLASLPLPPVSAPLVTGDRPLPDDQALPTSPIAPALTAASGSLADAIPPSITARTARMATPADAPAPTFPQAALPTRSAPVAQPHAIRAIASRVDTRTLVLVTAQNQVLDILTPQQQQWLYQRLADAVARYRRYQQIAQTPRWQFQVRLFPPKLRSTQFPPVRYFRALMAWMQQGPVAKLTNLFDEATLLTGDRWDLANLLTLPALPTLVDIGAAGLNASGHSTATPALPPPPSWLGTLPQSASTLIQQLIQQEVAHTSGPAAAIAVDLQWEGPADLWASVLPTPPGQGGPGSSSPVPGIPCPFPPSSPADSPAALPSSALPSAQSVPATAFLRSALRALKRQAVNSLPNAVDRVDPIRQVEQDSCLGGQPAPVSQWQAIVRLVRETPTWVPASGQVRLSPPVIPASGMPIQPSRRVFPGESPASPVSSASALIPQPPPAGPLQTTPATLVPPVPVPATATVPTTSGEASPTESTPPATDVAPVPATTLLEVEAQIMGYVKHPLEHVLEWLDQIMLWLETIAGRLWRWLQTHLPQL